MTVINQNVAAALNRAVFGRAVFGLDISSQLIPSELYDEAKNIGIVARPDGITSKRYPFRINQPGTPPQLEVWDIFKACATCFSLQPYEGGVTPPARGPRNRSWWYNYDPGVKPIYYNWFMQQSLWYYWQYLIPPWCVLFIEDITYVSITEPNSNFGGADRARWRFENTIEYYLEIQRVWLKTPGDFPKTLFLYITDLYTEGPPRDLAIHRQDAGGFDTATLTWNNQPALGPKAFTRSMPSESGVWWAFEIGPMDAICIKFDDETRGEETAIHNFMTATDDWGEEPELPYTSPST